jgi:hypothetical protein
MRDVIFLATVADPAEIAGRIATAWSSRTDWARVSHDGDVSEIRGAEAVLSPGATGELHAVLVAPDPAWPFYPPGEYAATDAYGLECRLMSDVDASAAFTKLGPELELPALLVRRFEWLVATYRPGAGRHDFPDGVSIHPDSAGRWQDWVLTSPATRRHQDTGGNLDEARDQLRDDLMAVALEVYPQTGPLVDINEGPLPDATEQVQWVLRVNTGAAAPPWDAPAALAATAEAFDRLGWTVLDWPYLDEDRWTVRTVHEGHQVTATMTDREGILRLLGQTPWYPPSARGPQR